MNFNKQDRECRVTLSPSLALRVNSAKGLARWAQRCFASLSMTIPVLVVKVHYHTCCMTLYERKENKRL